ncbi:aldehyde dehydrogenase family protein [Roseibium salinum]|nr:aldehyde dehydrogenase family protein [Roseibium salinum]
MTREIRPYWQNFIDGNWVDGADGSRITVSDPATGEPIAEVARALPADVDKAVAAARRCF